MTDDNPYSAPQENPARVTKRQPPAKQRLTTAGKLAYLAETVFWLLVFAALAWIVGPFR